MKLLKEDTLNGLSSLELLEHLSTLANYLQNYNRHLPYLAINVEKATLQAKHYDKVITPLEQVAHNSTRLKALIQAHSVYIRSIKACLINEKRQASKDAYIKSLKVYH